MTRPVDTPALTEVRAVLEGLSGTLGSVEDDLLACLVVMGEPDPQRAVDAWVDQVVDLLRAVDEVTGQHLSTLSRVSTRLGESDTFEDLTSVEQGDAILPVEHP
ncbi:hypothetical protein ACOCJ7_10875 [Knoellia sp. CPCC 206453]|uniref:hypothetical protein n=1 Tax=Knoellia pratensis TaxID=3404796 RepID=UPI00360B0B99